MKARVAAPLALLLLLACGRWSSMTVIALANSRDAEALRYAAKAWELDREDPVIAANSPLPITTTG